MNPTNAPRLWWTSRRIDEPELLDLGLAAPRAVRRSLREMWWINYWLGGYRALTCHLYPRLLAADSPLTLLDIGTGGGHIPAAITTWAGKHRRAVRVIGLDLAEQHLSHARDTTRRFQSVDLVQADALHLPLAPGSVDYLISSLFIHHLPPEQVVSLLRSAWRCARRGIVISDTVRGLLPALGFELLRPALSSTTRYDGRVSIRRSYTPAELEALAREANLPRARVYRHFPWRMTLVAEK